MLLVKLTTFFHWACLAPYILCDFDLMGWVELLFELVLRFTQPSESFAEAWVELGNILTCTVLWSSRVLFSGIPSLFIIM